MQTHESPKYDLRSSAGVLLFPVALTLVGAPAVALLVLPAVAGIVASFRGATSAWGKEEKLLLFGTVVLFSGVVLPRSLEAPWAIAASFVLIFPVHAWLRRHPPRAVPVWVGLGLTILVVVSGMHNLDQPGGRALGPAGVRDWAALVVFLGIPFRPFLHAVGGKYGAAHGIGMSGLLAVGFSTGLVLSDPAVFWNGIAAFLVWLSAHQVLLHVADRQRVERPIERKQTLSVTVITKDEADRIGRCLASVSNWADEMIVLDSGSTDATVEVSRRFTDHVFVTDWPGYGPQKQRALEKATCAWVLSIDADEEVSLELRHDIDEALTGEPECVAYRLPWGVVVYGKLLDFGRSARAPLRLFQREGARFTDAQVHETIVPADGPVGKLRGRLFHYTQRDFGHQLDKLAKYAWLGARERHKAGRRGGGLAVASLRATLQFLQIYVIRLGVLDGWPGFLVARQYAQVQFNKYAGLWALRREDRQRADQRNR